MTQGWLFVLVAILMVLSALILVLPAFFISRRDDGSNGRQENVVAARERLSDLQISVANNEIDAAIVEECEQEIEGLLLAERDGWQQVNDDQGRSLTGVILVVLALAVSAPLLYIALGTPMVLTPPASMAELMGRLEAQVVESPDDLDSIIWLARVLAAEGRISEAKTYYTRARVLAGDQPELLLEQINMLLQQRPEQVEIGELLQIGMDMVPQHPMFLWLAGIHAENQGDLERALSYWRHALADLADKPQWQEIVKEKIIVAEQQLHGGPSVSAVEINAPDTVVADRAVSVMVSLSGSFMVAPETTLFVFAKAAGGQPPMPLAVYRGVAKDIPLTVQLSDDAAMMSALKMSNFDAYDITALLSSSGDLSVDIGGWFGTVRARPGDVVSLMIDQKIP